MKQTSSLRDSTLLAWLPALFTVLAFLSLLGFVSVTLFFLGISVVTGIAGFFILNNRLRFTPLIIIILTLVLFYKFLNYALSTG